MTWAIAIFLRPLVILVLMATVLIPVRIALMKWMPRGRIKSLLLFEVFPDSRLTGKEGGGALGEPAVQRRRWDR